MNYFNILLCAAAIPEIVFMVYLYRKDRVEKEPVLLLLLLIIGGIISCLPAIILESILESALSIFYSSYLVYYIIDAFVIVALSEEACKYFFLKIFSWKRKSFNSSFDGIIYAAFVSAGFALGENILYTLQNGLSTALSRAFTAIPAHIAFGILMGYFYSKAKIAYTYGDKIRSRSYRYLALGVPVFLHGMYDFCIFVSIGVFGYIWFVVLLVIYAIIFYLVKMESKNDHLFIYDYPEDYQEDEEDYEGSIEE